MATFELVCLAKLDAAISKDLQYTRHTYTVTGTGYRAVSKEAVWKRTAKPLVAGGYGKVFREECTEGEPLRELRAVKCILKSSSAKPRKPTMPTSLRLWRASLTLRKTDPDTSVASFGWYETNDAILIAMEFVELGDLQSYLQSPFSERETQQIILQVLRGLTCMHAAGYAYRDLKPAHVKIADFGLSKRVLTDSTALRTTAGTQDFMAPEMLGLGSVEYDSSDENTQRSDSYTNAVNIWAVGVIAYLLLTGEMPFSRPKLGRYASGKIMFPMQAFVDNGVGQEAQTTIKSFTASDPRDRPSADASINKGWLSMNMPWESSKATQDVPSAQWSAGSQDSGYHGQYTLPAIGTQYVNTSQRPEDRNTRPAFTNREGPSTLANPEIVPRTRAVPVRSPELPAVPGQHQGAGEVNVRANVERAGHMCKGTYWESYQITKPEDSLTEMSFSGDGQIMASVSYGQRDSLIIWDVATSGQPIHITSLDDPAACGLRFSQNGQRFVFASKKAIMVYDLKGPSRPMRLDSIEPTITGREHIERRIELALSPDGHLLAYEIKKGGLKLRILSQTSRDRALEMPACWWEYALSRHVGMKHLAFSPDGRVICAIFLRTHHSEPEVELLLWDAANCRLLVMNNPMKVLVSKGLHHWNSNFVNIAFSPDGQLIAFGHGDGITVVSVAALRIVKTLGYPTSYVWVYSLAFRPDGGLMAVMMQDLYHGKSATVTWDLSTGTSVVCPLEADSCRAAISPDGMKIATVTSSSNKLWRLK
ncbi:hypothetical protein LTS10_010477 [Elasticomyces elasticus]|nr:hypothetical protein LTS10_010477 [Elasticomyces elasticus]